MLPIDIKTIKIHQEFTDSTINPITNVISISQFTKITSEIALKSPFIFVQHGHGNNPLWSFVIHITGNRLATDGWYYPITTQPNLKFCSISLYNESNINNLPVYPLYYGVIYKNTTTTITLGQIEITDKVIQMSTLPM